MVILELGWVWGWINWRVRFRGKTDRLYSGFPEIHDEPTNITSKATCFQLRRFARQFINSLSDRPTTSVFRNTFREIVALTISCNRVRHICNLSR